MRTILLSLFFCLSAFSQIVFLDINNNQHEKKVAIEAAKKAGKTIIVYPEDDAEFEKEKAFEVLKKTPPETIFISGHDGGGSFGGDRGESFSRSDLHELVEREPVLKDRVRVLGLLGCNTANHSQILDWKLTFPNLSFVAGYDGSAPAGDKPAGWSYIRDTISKTDQILKETDKDRLKATFESFENIYYLEATLYAQTCGEQVENQFIFRPMRKGDERFKLFDTAECSEKKKLYSEQYEEVYTDYYKGHIGLPENTSTGPLRDLYTFMRQNEHCFRDFRGSSEHVFPTGDELLFLLFYQDVRKNFSVYYRSELEKFFNKLKILQDRDALKERHAVIEAKNKDELGLMHEMLNDQELFKKEYLKSIAALAEKLESYPARYEELYQELLFGAGASSELPDDFNEFSNLRGRLSFLKDDIERGKESAIYSLMQYRKTKFELGTLSGAPNFQDFVEAYNKLPAKNFKEFKDLDRAQLLDFLHGLNGLELQYTKAPKFVGKMKSSIESMLERLDPQVLPFNWHDGGLAPQTPLWASYSKERINQIDEEQPLIDELFAQIWGN